MARTNSNDLAKPVATDTVLPTTARATDAPAVDSGTVGGDQLQAGTVSTTASGASFAAPSRDVDAGAVEANAQTDGTQDSGEIMIYPLRSYLDGKEVRRAGGKGYKSPKHDAVSLVAAGLATDKKPKA